MANKWVVMAALLALFSCAVSAQTTDTKDWQVAKQGLKIGPDSLTQIIKVITAAVTHKQTPTAKAVYDYVSGLPTGGVPSVNGITSAVTIAGGGINAVGVSGTTITVTGTEVDGSTTNELQTLSIAGNVVSLSPSGGSVTVPVGPTYTAGTAININGSNVISNTGDLSNTNETNTSFSVSGGALVITDPNSTLSVPVTTIAPDQSTTNEIQSLSLVGQALGISGSTGVNLPIVGVSAGAGIGVSVASGVATVTNTGDASSTNEGTLGVGAGLSNTAVITSNTSGANGISVIGGTGISVSEVTGTNGGNITVALTGVPWLDGGNTLSATGTIGTNSNHALQLETNGTTKVHIAADGKVGLATTLPATTLDLSSTSDGIFLPSGSNATRPSIGAGIVRRNGNGSVEVSNGTSDWTILSAQSGIVQSFGTGIGTAPTFTIGAGANILSGRYTFTVGTAPQADGKVFSYTLPAGLFTHTPTATVYAGNKQAASDSSKFYTTETTTEIGVFVNGTLTAGAVYIIKVQIQN